jgi:hypothetical protein
VRWMAHAVDGRGCWVIVVQNWMRRETSDCRFRYLHGIFGARPMEGMCRVVSAR